MKKGRMWWKKFLAVLGKSGSLGIAGAAAGRPRNTVLQGRRRASGCNRRLRRSCSFPTIAWLGATFSRAQAGSASNAMPRTAGRCSAMSWARQVPASGWNLLGFDQAHFANGGGGMRRSMQTVSTPRMTLVLWR